MSKWKKSSEALTAAFTASLPDDVAVERRQMFGYPCAFVGGNMVTGLHEERLLVRLGDAERAKLLAVPGAHTFEPMPGRPMKEYVVVPPAWHADPKTLRAWIAKAITYGKSLPKKGTKKPAPKKAAAKKPAKKPAAKSKRRAK